MAPSISDQNLNDLIESKILTNPRLGTVVWPSMSMTTPTMPSPAADATCTLTASGAVTVVEVGTKCKVRYEPGTRATNADLALRYAVTINDSILPDSAFAQLDESVCSKNGRGARNVN